MPGDHALPMEQSLGQIDLAALARDREYYPSPAAWEDEVLYKAWKSRSNPGTARRSSSPFRRRVLLSTSEPTGV
jgi:hypothetical protein